MSGKLSKRTFESQVVQQKDGKRSALWIWVLVAAFLCAIAPHLASAQSGTGAIKGVVTDASGAVIPGAAVTAVSLNNGFTRTTVSGADGSFLIPLLDPQDYRLQVVAPGFKKLERGPITVQVTETADVGRIPLTVGEQSETVTVTGQEELLNTENATLGKVYDAALIEGLPLSTRNFTQLIGLQAGVIGGIPDSLAFGNGTTLYAVGGNRTYDNNINIDGLNALSVSGNNSFSVPSPDALDEFKVQTSNYSAEYGRAGGASVDVTTKSGTNQFHGDLFYFFRNKALDANSYFNKQSQILLGTPNVPLDLRQNQWGGTLGGPIKRNKMTFFISYQNTKQIDGNVGFVQNYTWPLIPTGDRTNSATFAQALGAIYGGETGLLGGAAFASNGGNLNPVTLALFQAKFPNGQYILPSFPKADVLHTGRNDISYASFDQPSTYTEKQYMGNVDYKINSKQTLTEKYFDSHTETLALNGNVGGFSTGGPTVSENASLTHTWILTPTFVNEAKAGWLHQYSNSANNNNGLTATEIGMKQVPHAMGAFPLFLIAQDGILISGSTALSSQDEHQYSLSDVVSKNLSHHNIRAGFIAMQHQLNTAFTDAGGVFVYQVADWLIGNAGNIFLSANSAGDFTRNFRFNDYSYFVQDDYKVFPNLTLSLGLRWDYFQQPTEVNGLMDNFLPDKVAEGAFGTPNASQAYTGYAISGKYLRLHPNFVVPAGITVLNDQDGLTPKYKNYAPRVGFAWQPEKNLSVRGGFGLFFNRASAAVAEAGLIGAPFNNRPLLVFPGAATLQDPFDVLGLLPDSAYPIWTPRTYSPTSVPGVSLNVPKTNVGNPYTEQWNLNIQQQFGRDLLFELAYQGSNGVKLLEGLSANQAGIASTANPIRGITTNLPVIADGGQNTANRSPYAGIGPDEELAITGTSASSHFNALEATVDKRLSHGLQFISALTWSRNEDSDTVGAGEGAVGSGAVPPNDNTSTHHMAISGNDRALRFTTSAVYVVPNPIKNPHNFAQGSLNHLIGGWGLAGTMVAQTGPPISFQISNDTTQSSAIAYDGNLTDNLQPGYTIHDIAKYGAARNRLTNYFNTGGVGTGTGTAVCAQISGAPSKLACPGATQFGNLPTNTSLRQPGQKDIDLALTKTTKVFEGYNIEFRGDFFNAFNWVEFAGPDAGITDATFGVISGTTVEPRVIQVSAKIKF
jgi:outer membrane receptor protein involved in Fe transport